MRVFSSHQTKKLCSQMVDRGTRLLFAGLLTVSFLTATGEQTGRHIEQQSYVKATPERGWQQFQRRLDWIQKRRLRTMTVQYAAR